MWPARRTRTGAHVAAVRSLMADCVSRGRTGATA